MRKEGVLKPGVSPCAYCGKDSTQFIDDIPVCNKHLSRPGVKVNGLRISEIIYDEQSSLDVDSFNKQLMGNFEGE